EAGRVVGPAVELTSGNNVLGFIDPSPDGKAIAFGAARGGSSRIWRLDPPGHPTALTGDPAFSDGDPTWSPDGRQIAFMRVAGGASEAAFAAPVGGTSMWLMNADGSSPRRIAEAGGSGAGAAVWLPDGKTVLIPRGDELIQLNLATGKATPVPGASARTIYV